MRFQDSLWAVLLTSRLVLAQRKSLAFGPSLPHAKFVTEVSHFEAQDLESLAGLDQDSFPLAVRNAAKRYLEGIIPKEAFVGATPQEGRDYIIRDDSYTDASTGITRIFVRQIIDNLEVADGDISLNIDQEGRLLSYGDSVCLSSLILNSKMTLIICRSSFLDKLTSLPRQAIVRKTFTPHFARSCLRRNCTIPRAKYLSAAKHMPPTEPPISTATPTKVYWIQEKKLPHVTSCLHGASSEPRRPFSISWSQPILPLPSLKASRNHSPNTSRRWR